MLAELIAAARDAGVKRIVGEYLPTAKNGMVRDLFARLGFEPLGGARSDGGSAWALDVEGALRPADSELIRREPKGTKG
jgi:hypothetical protein